MSCFVKSFLQPWRIHLLIWLSISFKSETKTKMYCLLCMYLLLPQLPLVLQVEYGGQSAGFCVTHLLQSVVDSCYILTHRLSSHLPAATTTAPHRTAPRHHLPVKLICTKKPAAAAEASPHSSRSLLASWQLTRPAFVSSFAASGFFSSWADNSHYEASCCCCCYCCSACMLACS